MRFNPPTSWPATPAGWTPPEGWNPDPEWPPAPHGWPFWLADDGTPLPVTGGPSVQPWDPRSVVPAAAGAGAAIGAGPAAWIPEGSPVDAEAAVRETRRGALRQFLIGVAVFVAVGVAAYVTDRLKFGTVLWIGGLLVGGTMMLRAFTEYRGTQASGVAVLPRSIAIVTVGSLLAVGGAASAVTSWADAKSIATGVGSCWSIASDEEVEAVDCDEEHDLVLVAVVDSEDQCPDSTLGVVELEPRLGCLTVEES